MGTRWAASVARRFGVIGITVAALVAPAAAHALTVTRSVGSAKQRVVSGPSGYAIYNLSAGGQVAAGEIIDYRRRVVDVVDAGHHRFQAIPLSDAVARARTQQKLSATLRIEDVAVSKLKRERARATSRRRRIDGVVTRAWLLQTASGDLSRAWYTTSLGAPRAVSRLLAPLGPVGGRALVGQIALLVEHRVGHKWVKVSKATRVRRSTPASALRVPRGFHKGRVVPPVQKHIARIASTPAHLRVPFAGGYFPVEQHQAVFTVFQGAMFGSNPGLVHSLNAAVAGPVEHSPYVDGLAQYGVGTGSLVGSVVHPVDPPAEIGDTSVQGFAAGLGIVEAARTRDGAPFTWSRFGPDPLVVVFVPKDAVHAGNNNGYHSVVPVDTAVLDPLGLVQLQVYPYAIVKVPTPSTDANALDEATTVLSHETTEAATDPVATDWTDPTKGSLNPPEQGEVADICHEGNHSPWGDTTRVGGVAVATYWSNADNACVPESRPTAQITSPSAGATVVMGLGVGLAGTASDPLNGALTGNSLQWSDDVAGPLGAGTSVIAHLQPGVHHITLTATDSQGLTATATETITVVPGAPSVHITNPADGSSFGSDQTVTFQGSAHDPQDGDLTGSHLHWELLSGGSPIADMGTGAAVAYRIATQGDYTVQLTATDAEGAHASASITVHVGAPSGNPSVAIDQPLNGASFYSGSCTSTVSVHFQGHATDPVDGTLTGASLVWYLDYGTASQATLGTGTDFFHDVPQDCAVQRSHTVTVIATDSHGHQSSYTVTITTGAPG
jgi:hypothetical protein